MMVFILAALLAAWLLFTFAMAWINLEAKTPRRLARTLWNARIAKLRRPPFSLFMRVYEDKNYLLSFLMVLLINGVMNVFMYLAGLCKIGLLFIPVQAFTMGAVIGMADPVTKVYGVVTAAFELSAFTISCCLGFWGALSWWWVPAVCLALNAASEAAGVLIGAQGFPGVQAVKNEEYRP